MDKCQEQIIAQNHRIQQAAVEKDNLLKQADQIKTRMAELDRTIVEARGVIAGIEHARQILNVPKDAPKEDDADLDRADV